MVSIMNEALQLEVSNKVLEVGSGSGWHAATMAELVAPNGAPRSEYGHVYTIEIVQGLADFARKNIMKAGYGDRVTIIYGDGSLGFLEKAPYDRILVTAAAPSIKSGGLMLIPVGNVALFQNLLRITKENGNISQKNLGGVAFVPLTGKHGCRS
jgi:protein-L-isoaspartate(D-aspartate) O-methyltransferase